MEAACGEQGRTKSKGSSMNQTVLATKKFRMTKSQENAVLNILTENSCLFVVISYIFSLCRSLSAVAFLKADAFVAMSQLCKTKPICWTLK
jgi:hypothetical protein